MKASKLQKKLIEINTKFGIFLKSNWLESFSYPSLKIMETVGYSIVMPNSGNKDYLNDGEKCLLYKL